MAMDALSKLLSQRDWLMADGATGTNLFNMGLESGEPPEFWNTDKPDNIRKLYKAAVDAGSDIFLTNSFGGNAARLKLHQATSRVGELKSHRGFAEIVFNKSLDAGEGEYFNGHGRYTFGTMKLKRA